MKVIFAGTPDFAVPALQSLIDSSHEVIAVYTQPDRPAGRGRKLTASPIKQLALKYNIPVYQPLSLKHVEIPAADLMVVVAYGLILPQTVLSSPRLGCLNIHASLLPHWRGAAPIQRAILAGDTETGITIMQMDAGLDTGNMLYQVKCPIATDETAQQLHDRLSLIGASALLTTLETLPNIHPIPQNNADASYASKLSKLEAKLDWTRSATELDRAVRAYNPWPMAYTMLNDQPMRILCAVPIFEENSAVPGTILEVGKMGIDVATGSGILRLLSIQLPGRKPIAISDYVNAHQRTLIPGTLLGK